MRRQNRSAALGRPAMKLLGTNSAQMSISQENMNVLRSDLITMVPEWNYFIFMQIDNPRWPPGAVTKIALTRK